MGNEESGFYKIDDDDEYGREEEYYNGDEESDLDLYDDIDEDDF